MELAKEIAVLHDREGTHFVIYAKSHLRRDQDLRLDVAARVRLLREQNVLRCGHVKFSRQDFEVPDASELEETDIFPQFAVSVEIPGRALEKEFEREHGAGQALCLAAGVGEREDLLFENGGLDGFECRCVALKLSPRGEIDFDPVALALPEEVLHFGERPAFRGET